VVRVQAERRPPVISTGPTRVSAIPCMASIMLFFSESMLLGSWLGSLDRTAVALLFAFATGSRRRALAAALPDYADNHRARALSSAARTLVRTRMGLLPHA